MNLLVSWLNLRLITGQKKSIILHFKIPESYLERTPDKCIKESAVQFEYVAKIKGRAGGGGGGGEGGGGGG